MKRISFLPAFFVCLAIVFSIVIAFRIHSYQVESSAAPPPAREPLTTPDHDLAGDDRQSESKLTIVPPPTQPMRTPTDPPPSRTEAVLPPAAEVVPQDEISGTVGSVWFDPKSIRTGQAQALHLRLAPKADVKALGGVLQSASRTARLPFQCSPGADSVWTCTLTVPSCVACGRWTIEHLEVTTGAGKVVEVPGSHPLIARSAIHLSGDRCDSAPPILHAVTVNEIAPGDGEGDNILVTLTVADGYCGVSGVKGTVESSRGQTFPLSAILAGDENTWVARVRVSKSTERGKWRVSSIELIDEATNFRTYSESDPLLKDAVFEVR